MTSTSNPFTKPWRVLVVDDEENLNWSLVNSLRRDAYLADGAHTGIEARQKLGSGTYDLVLSDVRMPGMDGFELLMWLRQHHPQTRVIIMTAFGSPTARDEALRGGVIAYLEKPFDLRALKDLLIQLRSTPQANPTPSATVETYDLLDIVQVLHLTRRDMTLRVQHNLQPHWTATLTFQHGELIFAEAEGEQGEAVFLRAANDRNTIIQPETITYQPTRNITVPLSRLIFQALQQREQDAQSTHKTVQPPVNLSFGADDSAYEESTQPLNKSLPITGNARRYTPILAPMPPIVPKAQEALPLGARLAALRDTFPAMTAIMAADMAGQPLALEGPQAILLNQLAAPLATLAASVQRATEGTCTHPAVSATVTVADLHIVVMAETQQRAGYLLAAAATDTAAVPQLQTALRQELTHLLTTGQ